MAIKTLEDALKRIKELEEENKKLTEENEELKKRKVSGRRKHDEKWMASFNRFAELYKSGLSIVEIVEQGGISRRTAYRYRAYYEEINNKRPE